MPRGKEADAYRKKLAYRNNETHREKHKNACRLRYHLRKAAQAAENIENTESESSQTCSDSTMASQSSISSGSSRSSESSDEMSC